MQSNYYSMFRQPTLENVFAKQKNIMGQYDLMNHFVKLCPDYYHTLLAANGDDPSYEDCLAFSTYLHENIHWWQCCGSTIGFPLGLSVALQAHANHKFLRNISTSGALVKPIVDYYEVNSESSPDHNRIINNWCDIEFAQLLLRNPLRIESIKKTPYFDSVGHSLEILYGNCLNLLVATIDKNNSFVPDYKSWESNFQSLRARKQTNWGYGSQIKVPPFGFISIIEGQARLSQLRYLYLASSSKLTWDDFKKRGLMGASYFESFKAFLTILDMPFPSTPMDPIVSMFLLVCDIAINPSEGYPCPISDFSSFIDNVSPGIRFIFAANVLRNNKDLLKILKKLNKEEYDSATSAICARLGWLTPKQVAQYAYSSISKSNNIKKFYEDANKGIYENTNFSIRLYYAKHLDFMSLKSSRPDFLCWPERWMIDNSSGGYASDLQVAKDFFDKYHCPFTWNPITDRIEAHENLSSEPSKRVELISSYYNWQASFDIVRQWITQKGDFSFSFCWADKLSKEDELRDWATKDFEINFGCKIDDIIIL